jgi:PilZ domain-containing protein
MNKNRNEHITRLWEVVRRSRDRRGAPRYTPSGDVIAQLSWRDGEEYRYLPAKIMNLSTTGALLQVRADVALGGPYWVRLEQPESTNWLEGEVLRTEKIRGDERHLRMTFRESCPYEFFKAAINGFQQQGTLMTPNKELKNAQWW